MRPGADLSDKRFYNVILLECILQEVHSIYILFPVIK